MKFIGYFPDYLSALSRTLSRFFGQHLSKQLYSLIYKYVNYYHPRKCSSEKDCLR